MKTILCYGDSNTWGCMAAWSPKVEAAQRFNEETRWGSVMRSDLPDDYRVIEEGLCGRATVYGDGEEGYKNGEPYLLPCLLSHHPLDLVVLMLGTNDLKEIFHVTPETLGNGLKRLIHIIKGCPTCGADKQPPKILVISPILVERPEGRMDFYLARGGERAHELSTQFAKVYSQIAKDEGCGFLDAAQLAVPSPADGLHMDANSHIRLGHAAAQVVRAMLEE